MKKISLILLLVLLISAMLMAAAPLRLVRLYVINKSGHSIYMKLNGEVNDQFYYLTIPYGNQLTPAMETYTLVEDVYVRQTWYGPGDLDCEGWMSKGSLWAVKQLKLTFTPCGMETNGMGEPTWGEKVTYWKEIQSAWGVGVPGQGCVFVVRTVTRYGPQGSCWFLYKY